MDNQVIFLEPTVIRAQKENVRLRLNNMDMKVGSIIALAIFVVVAMSLVPTVFNTINGTNTSAWSALTGGSGAKAIFELVLLVFCAAIIVIIVRQALE